MKSQGQTDKRILGLSFKDFKEEFGFKPDDKIEQRHFADTGRRLTNPEERERAVTCFQTHIGAGNPVGGTDVSTMGVFGFYFPVSRRFPNDAEVIVRCDSGDGAVSASMNILSWVEEEV